MKFHILGKKDSNIVFLFLSLLISLIFLSALLKYGPVDPENYNCGVIFSALIRAQHLLKGQFLLWHDGLGFGTSFPISPLIDLHPIFASSPFLSMRIVRLLFWIIHLSIGSFFFMKLCRLLSMSRTMSLISGFLYVFSLPTINYTITDDWVSPFVIWTMYPLIVFVIFKIFLQNKRKFNYLIFLLPIILAFTIYNAPTVLNSWIILFFCILLIFLYHPKNYKFKHLLTIFILTSILVAPRYYYILNEIPYFPDGLVPRTQGPFTLKHLISNEFIPFNIDLFRSIANNSFSTWWANAIDSLKYHDAARTSFNGFVYFILAFTGITILWRHLRGKSKQISDVAKASAVLGFLLAWVISLLPKSFFLNTISPWHFRDQTVFFGIIVAGIQLQRLKAGIFKNYNVIIPLLIIIQINHVLAYTRYLIFTYPSEMPTRNFFRSPERDGRLLNWLKYYNKASNKRILLSPEIEYYLNNPNKELISEGFYAMSDLNLHAGLNPVNSIFKGVSMDRIYPSSVFSLGLIKSNYDLLKNSALLDIAGINFLLVHESELENLGSLPPRLSFNVIRAQVDTSQSRFGGASILCDGTGYFFQLDANKEWALGSEDFTVDFWVRFASTSGTQMIVGHKYYIPDRSWQIAWEEERKSLLFCYSTDGSNGTGARFPWSPSTDTWYHIAIARNGSDLKAFVNGSQIGSKHHIRDISIHDSTDPLYIGSRGGLEEHVNGWLDEIRITRGIARWTSDFSPPSDEYSTDSHTKLLLHCNGTEDSYFRFKNTHVWILFHNEGAWSRAFFISEKALHSRIDYRPECGHDRFLCANLDESLSYKEEGKVGIKGDNGSYELTFSPKKENSFIGLSTLYRPEWKAYADGEKLEIKPLFNAFIAIKVPPGVSQISLEFKQPLRILLLYISLITFVSCFLVTFILLLKKP